MPAPTVERRVEQVEKDVKELRDRLDRENLDQMFKTLIIRGDNDRLLADERHTAILARLDRIDGRLDRMDDRFDQVDARFDEVLEAIAKLKAPD
jgi:hypothetical protein